MAPYILDRDRADGRQDLLAQTLDGFTRRRIRTAVPDLEGTACWEAGAGAGTVAVWLASQVGPFGTVLATDLDVARIPDRPRLERLVHNVATERAPVPRHRLKSAWDLIHARLLLAHLGNRLSVLHRMAAALAPGGTVLIEDWHTANSDTLLSAPSPEAATLYREFQELLSGRVFGESGTNRAWAREIHAAMLTEGLVDVHTVIHSESWAAGDPACRAHALTLHQLRPRLRAVGLADRQLDEVYEMLVTPGSGLVVRGHFLYSTSGHRPE